MLLSSPETQTCSSVLCRSFFVWMLRLHTAHPLLIFKALSLLQVSVPDPSPRSGGCLSSGWPVPSDVMAPRDHISLAGSKRPDCSGRAHLFWSGGGGLWSHSISCCRSNLGSSERLLFSKGLGRLSPALSV